MKGKIATAALAALLAAALVPTVRHLRETPPEPPPPIVLTLPPPVDTEVGSGFDRTFELAVSPTERDIVFAATARGETRLWRRRLDGERADPLPGTNGAMMPTFSADGAAVWFFADGTLRRLDLSKDTVSDVFGVPTPAGVSVRADGVALVGSASGPIARLATGAATNATEMRDGERSHSFPVWTSDGNAFVYLVTRADGKRLLRIRTGDDDRELTSADSHGVLADGQLIHVRESTLLAAPLDPKTLRLGSLTTTIAYDVGVAASGAGAFAVSPRLLAYAAASRRARVLRWYATDGGALDDVAEPADLWQVRLAPDERTAALAVRDPLLRTLDIFTVPARGGPSSRFTLALATDTDPVWSPDGRRIAFRSLQDGEPNLFSRAFPPRMAGSTTDDPLWRSPLDEIPTDWTPAGVIFHARSAATGYDIWRVRPGATAATALVKTTFNEMDGRASPDGRWLAYASDESGHFDVYVARLPDGEPRVRISTAGGIRPQWGGDGRSLVFLRSDTVMRATVDFGAGIPRPSVPEPLLTLAGSRDLALSADGRRVVAIVPAEGFRSPSVRFVVNWRSLMR